MLDIFEEKLKVKSENNPGLIRKMGTEYFKRVDALEFAVKYDDGKDINGFREDVYKRQIYIMCRNLFRLK